MFKNYNTIGPLTEQLRRKAIQFYNISEIEVSNYAVEKRIHDELSNSLQKYKYWKKDNYMGGGLVNIDSSCFMISTLQCLAYIPDLTRLLLENDLFQDTPTNTFLHRFINLLKLLFKEKDELNKLQGIEKADEKKIFEKI